MDLRELREQTRPEHEATEAMMPLTAPGLTIEAYRQVLAKLLPVVRSWERWAASVAPEALRPLLGPRRRSQMLEADLAALGTPVRAGAEDAEAAVDWEAVIWGEAEGRQVSSAGFEAGFLGAMYVMEGSTLGGRFIARHVEDALGLTPGEGDAYFQGHGEQTGSLWRELTAVIAEIPEAQSAEVVGAAKRTFEAFGKAMTSAVPVEGNEI